MKGTVFLQAKRNDELSIELLNLVNAKAALMKQIHALSDSDTGIGDPDAEVSRVKAFVIKNSSGKVKVVCLITRINVNLCCFQQSQCFKGK